MYIVFRIHSCVLKSILFANVFICGKFAFKARAKFNTQPAKTVGKGVFVQNRKICKTTMQLRLGHTNISCYFLNKDPLNFNSKYKNWTKPKACRTKISNTSEIKGFEEKVLHMKISITPDFSLVFFFYCFILRKSNHSSSMETFFSGISNLE